MCETWIGLDIETTGSDRDQHQMIQIGVAYGIGRTFVSDIGWASGKYNWTKQALAINKFTHERIWAGPPASDVDQRLYRFLTASGATKGSLVPVGWNVGTFDMPFVRETLPVTATLFGYRSTDLNSACFLLEGKGLPESMIASKVPTWMDWKAMAKAHARDILRNMGYEIKVHDAEYDAIEALFAYQRLKYYAAEL